MRERRKHEELFENDFEQLDRQQWLETRGLSTAWKTND